VSLNLYKGNVIVDGRSSPNSLYDEASPRWKAAARTNQTDAEGFLRIQGLPGRVQARVWPRKFEERSGIRGQGSEARMRISDTLPVSDP